MRLAPWFLLFTLCSAIMAREPQCSRFHYEEQLLEKVIRSEIRMETLDTAVEKVRTDMEADIQTLKGRPGVLPNPSFFVFNS